MFFFKKSQIIIITVTIILFVILLSLTFAQSPNTKPTARTDKIAYSQLEPIKITLTNDLGESIFSHIRSGTQVFCIKCIEKSRSNEQWERLYAQCQYPNCMLETDAPGEIKSGENATYAWKPSVFVNGTSESVSLMPGTYRLLISYEDCRKTKWDFVNTNKFEIFKEEQK
jgi:hypothetical protein